MKKIALFSIVALAALALAACQTEKEPLVSQDEDLITATRGVTPTRSFLTEETDAETGESAYPIFWDTPDFIYVTYAGADLAEFISKNTTSAQEATFGGKLPEGDGPLYGIYPAVDGNYADSEGLFHIQFHADQNAVEGSFDPDAFPAVAVSETKSLQFYNVCGLLKLKVAASDVSRIELRSLGSIFFAEATDDTAGDVPCDLIGGALTVSLDGNVPAIVEYESILDRIVLKAPDGGCFSPEGTYYMVVPPCSLTDGAVFSLTHSEADDAVEQVIITGTANVERGKVHEVPVLGGDPSEEPEEPVELVLSIETVWLKQSGDSAWNTYFGGTAGSDRNIAMDDEYVYIAENSGTAKLWAISISDPSQVKAVNVEGVTGGTHLLACPRVVKNTDSSVNGGKDVLICSNLTRGGEEPKLYMWVNGIDNAPKAITLNTWATGAWYGDVFTVYGTLQDGLLLFDKIGGDGANGIVTFILNGVPSGSNMYLVSRLKFNDAMGSHSGACAYYPFPGDINNGIYSPGRGTEARGKSVTFSGDPKNEGGFDVTLTNLEYAEGRNGFVLGYNYIEWEGMRYVIYGKQPDKNTGYVYVLEGEANDDWLTIANTAGVKFRRDLFVASGSLSSGNSAMDVTARVIDGDLYFAAQKQNVACGVYKLVYKPAE
ncbi:MAG: hypothetical protein J5533_06720 [Bacteroidales bacterium]|nr:hypothetical protein [Bacteroidales bacterium]